MPESRNSNDNLSFVRIFLTDSIPVYLVLCSLLLFCAGCGSKHELVAVKGVVTLDGGGMPAEGSVQFLPVEMAAGLPLRPGVGEFNQDGCFEATSYLKGDGLHPGKYRICVQCWKIKPLMDGPPAVSHVPLKYQNANTSGLELIVEPGSSPIVFDVPLITQ